MPTMYELSIFGGGSPLQCWNAVGGLVGNYNSPVQRWKGTGFAPRGKLSESGILRIAGSMLEGGGFCLFGLLDLTRLSA